MKRNYTNPLFAEQKKKASNIVLVHLPKAINVFLSFKTILVWEGANREPLSLAIVSIVRNTQEQYVD